MPLKTWSKVRDEGQKKGGWPVLLVGNGASRAVSARFGYHSLFKRACEIGGADQLGAVDKSLFTRAGTEDFEVILAQLRDAMVVAEELGAPAAHKEQIQQHYTGVRRALASEVRSVHPSQGRVDAPRLRAIGDLLLDHKWVFSTNYDLLIYWAANYVGIEKFYDFLGGKPCRFRAENIPAPADETKLLFLHGGLHLYLADKGRYAGILHKRVNENLNILDQLLVYSEPPLVVAEGSPRDKRSVIFTHPYLAFAYEQLGKVRDPLVIFGSKLGAADSLLVEALHPLEGRRIAVSVREKGVLGNAVMARFTELLAGAEVEFFAAETHPLGDHALALPPGGFLDP